MARSRGSRSRDLDGDGVTDFTVFEGASSGLLSDDDLDEAGNAMLEPGTAALVIVFENRWAAPFASAMRQAGGQLVAVRAHPHAGAPGRVSTRPRRSRPHDTNERSTTMPGLIRGVARTAVIAGTATAVSNRVSRRQAARWSQQERHTHSRAIRRSPTRSRAAAPPAADDRTGRSPS